MKTIAISALSVFVLSSLAILFRWGDTSERTVVEGFLFLDEQPLANADLFFVADSDDSAAALPSYISKANAGGYYEVPGGLPPGDYRVVVRACMPADGELTDDMTRLEELDSAQQMIMAEARAASSQKNSRRRTHRCPVSTQSSTPRSLPDLYSSAARTLLRVRVPDEGLVAADLYLSSELCEFIASAMPSGRRF